MAIFHCCVKTGGRASGQSAIAAAAYRSGEKLTCEETGKTSYYSNKKGIEDSGIMLCKNAPEKYKERSTLWNAVHKIESASNARLWREIEMALPKGFTAESRRAMVEEYCRGLVAQGMCADWAIHNKGDGNPHAHIMLTTRSITHEGEWAAKSKKVYILDDNGERIYTKTDAQGRKQYKTRKEDYNNWNAAERVEEWREAWAYICNKYLTPEQHIDHRSYERQEIEQIPTIHLGYIATALEHRDIRTDRGDINREIAQVNKQIKAIKADNEIISKEITETEEHICKRNNLGKAPWWDESGRDIIFYDFDKAIIDEAAGFAPPKLPELTVDRSSSESVACPETIIQTSTEPSKQKPSVINTLSPLSPVRSNNSPKLTTSSTTKSNILTVSTSPELMVNHRSSVSPMSLPSKTISETPKISEPKPIVNSRFNIWRGKLKKIKSLTDKIDELATQKFGFFDFKGKNERDTTVYEFRKERENIYEELKSVRELNLPHFQYLDTSNVTSLIKIGNENIDRLEQYYSDKRNTGHSSDEVNSILDKIQAQKELEQNKDRPRRKSKGWDISD